MSTRNPPGVIRDAIVDFMSRCDSEASLQEIQGAVHARLAGTVSSSSVRSYLRLNTPATFSRTQRGRYKLNNSQPSLPLFESPNAPFAPAFRCGQAVFHQCDCREWLRGRRPESIHAVVTDPPYGLVEYSDQEKQKLRAGRGGVWRIPPSFDGHKRSPLPRFTVLGSQDLLALFSFFEEWAELLRPVLVPGAHVIVASNPLMSHVVSSALAKAGLERRGEIIRLVTTLRGGDRPKNAHVEFPDVSVMPRSMWEPWLLFRKPIQGRVQDNLRKWKTGGLRRPTRNKPFCDVIKSSPTQPGERRIAAHPSLKPQSFLRRIVHACLPLGEGTVLDPFAGAGSTLAACEAVGYASIGIDHDPVFVRMAKDAIPRLARLKTPSPM